MKAFQLKDVYAVTFGVVIDANLNKTASYGNYRCTLSLQKGKKDFWKHTAAKEVMGWNQIIHFKTKIGPSVFLIPLLSFVKTSNSLQNSQGFQIKDCILLWTSHIDTWRFLCEDSEWTWAETQECYVSLSILSLMLILAGKNEKKELNPWRKS